LLINHVKTELQRQYYQQRKLIEEEMQRQKHEYRKNLDQTLAEQNVSRHHPLTFLTYWLHIQAIKDARERERLLEEKEIKLFADAKKVRINILCIELMTLSGCLENDEVKKRSRNGYI